MRNLRRRSYRWREERRVLMHALIRIFYEYFRNKTEGINNWWRHKSTETATASTFCFLRGTLSRLSAVKYEQLKEHAAKKSHSFLRARSERFTKKSNAWRSLMLSRHVLKNDGKDKKVRREKERERGGETATRARLFRTLLPSARMPSRY